MTQQATELIAKQMAAGAANARVWADILYNVKGLGAKGDGVTDDTAAIQSAITAAALVGGVVYFPVGTYIVTQFSITKAVTFMGAGSDVSIIKRKDNSANTQFGIFAVNAVDFFGMKDIGTDGNQANNVATQIAHNIVVSNYKNLYIDNCKFINSKGIGLMLTDSLNDKMVYIKNSYFAGNLQSGMRIQRTVKTNIDGSTFKSNQIGFESYGVSGEKNSGVNFVNNHSCFNTQDGVIFAGHINNDPSLNVAEKDVISNNHIYNNGGYGIGHAGSRATIADNHIYNNGIVDGFHSGLLINGNDVIAEGNHIFNNLSFFGVDIGDGYDVIFSNNTVTGNATGGSGGVGVNLESAIKCKVSNNKVDSNGNSINGRQIHVHGIGGADATHPFAGYTNMVSIVDNLVYLNTGQTGIRVDPYCDNVLCHDNQIFQATSFDRAVLFEAFSSGGNKAYDNYGDTLNPLTIASAATVIIPDTSGEMIIMSGAATVTAIRTYSFDAYLNKVSRVNVAVAGTGYTTPPTVAFSGGGGTGAVANAKISGGQVVGIEITNSGTGYTSAPTVTLSGGGGTGATATALTGCNNFAGRKLTIKMIGAVVFSGTGGNLVVAGGTATGTINSQIEFVGYQGNWYETNRTII